VSLPLTVLAAQTCLRLDVIGGAPTALLAATAWDDAGKLLSSAEGSSSATLFTCTRSKLRLDLEARARPGPYAVLWHAERWTDPAFAVHPVAAGRMLTRMVAGSSPVSLLEGVPAGARAFHAEAGQEVSWSEVVPAGQCMRIVAGSEGEGAGLIGRVVDAASGDELDRGHAAESVALRACATEGTLRAVRVSVRVTGGQLDVVVGERLMR
jgi:hypothetical protein